MVNNFLYIHLSFGKYFSLDTIFHLAISYFKNKVRMGLHDIQLESNRECSNIIEKQYNGAEEFVRELQVNDGSLSIVFSRNFSRGTRKVARKVTENSPEATFYNLREINFDFAASPNAINTR